MQKKVLMVCLGNICRSPLAEGILKNKANAKSIYVDSAGTSGFHVGEKPDPRSIAIAKKHGIDISNQSCRQIKPSDFDEFDFIFVMDKSNYHNVISLARSAEDKNKVDLILNLSHPNSNLEVPDPYYGGNQGFENVYRMLNEACERFIEKQ